MQLMRLEYKWLVGIVFVVALFMDLLDMTIVIVAIPTLASEFETNTTTIEWVVTGYLLSLALFIPVSGWLGDRFGTKRVFASAIVFSSPAHYSPVSPGTSNLSSLFGLCRASAAACSHRLASRCSFAPSRPRSMRKPRPSLRYR